jgi:intraflagellar transport protein 172
MQLRYLKTLQPPGDQIARVTALTWSPNNRRLAAATADRVVHLFDEHGEKKDKFSTKPGDPKGPKNYMVTGMAFSPDSTKLAVAQSDNIVFIYKLGVEWGEKKSICNKFAQSNAGVTCITWPLEQPNELVFGLTDGAVKVGILRSNKAQKLYSTDSYVTTLCSSPDGHSILSSHVDGSIYRFTFEDGGAGPSQVKLAHHTCVATALAWGESIIAAGNDGKVIFYDVEGGVQQLFDYTSDKTIKEFSSACFNPSGESVVLGAFNKLYVFNLNIRRNLWEEAGVKEVKNMYSPTALSWKYDGSRLTVGTLTGAVDTYDACLRRYRYKGKFEFTYVSLSQVIVKRLSSGTRIVLKSHFGYEILKINIYQDQYLIAHTPETLLIGDLESCKLSEVPWSGSGSERFIFENPAVCMVYNAGELSLVEYGRNEILGSARTEHVSPHYISCRLNEARAVRGNETGENKKIAYLMDFQVGYGRLCADLRALKSVS